MHSRLRTQHTLQGTGRLPNTFRCSRRWPNRRWVDSMSAGAVARPMAGQKDMTAQLLERAFTLALTARLKQYTRIDVDVRSTAWGLMEGKFGGLTVRGQRWRTPLELTAEQLMVDVGELVLDYQKLMWQQTVALKNVPQGSVSFTLTSQDLANFMVHPIMVAAASKAVKGHAFIFDRNTASVRIDPATGRGIVSYQGVWAGDGQRYAVAMSTPPPASPSAVAAGPRAAPAASAAAPSNTLEQLTVSAHRVGAPPGTPTLRSTTGSYASMGSMDQPAAAASAPGRVTEGVASRGVQALGSGALSAASASSEDDDSDPGAELVAEGLRRFFSSLVLNLQGIELRQPTLLVQLPGASGGSSASAARGAPAPRGMSAAVPGRAGSGTLPALLTITMKVAILQLPPLNMKF